MKKIVKIIANFDGTTRTTDGETMLLLAVPKPEIADDLKNLIGNKVVVEIKKYSVGRSLKANDYFHVLVNLLRKKLNISEAKCKNIMIGRYGVLETLEDGSPIVYKTNAPPEYIDELETAHMRLVRVCDDTYFYKVYRGTHLYTSSEMATLINGTVADCKEQGIETLPPAEIERMCQLWKGKKLDGE